MKPVHHIHTTDVLTAPEGHEDNVLDLPICRTYDSAGSELVISVWELTEVEVAEFMKNKRIYFSCYGHTHPPVALNVFSLFGDDS